MIEDSLYEVRIYGPDGKLKKLVPPKTLHRRHWLMYDEQKRRSKKGQNFILFNNTMEPLGPLDGYDDVI